MFHQSLNMPSLFQMYAKKLAIAIMAIALTIFAWANLCLNVNTNATIISEEIIGSQINLEEKKNINITELNLIQLTN